MSSISNLVNNDDLLRYAVENGIIDTQRIQAEIEMDRRKKILNSHPYQITYNEKKGRFFTRFPTDNGLVQKSKKDRKELEDMIVEFYTENSNHVEESIPKIYSFSMAHDRWLEMQSEYGKSDNTIYRYEADWKRFFANTNFASLSVEQITPKDIELFMINTIKEQNLKRQAGVTLYGYITGVFYNAVIDGYIKPNENPCLLVDTKKFKRFYNTEQKTAEQRTMSAENIRDLVDRVNSDIVNKEDFLPPYAVKLSLLTGMRSGEICGLRWENVHDNYIRICESEKFNSRKKEYYQSSTKNNKIRNIPLTTELKKFFDVMREFQKKYGCLDGFVISTATEKCRTRKLSDYMIKRSKALGFDISKNIHTIRRTFNSMMRSEGVSALTAGSILGNTVEVNNNNYTYDVDEMLKKCDTITSAENKMLSGIALFQ